MQHTGSNFFFLILPVPCNPQYLGADVDCANNSMRLSWDHVDTAISYMAFVNASSKEQLHCDTTNTTCYIQHLSCATKYKVWFYAYDGFCTSIIKSAYDVNTGKHTTNTIHNSNLLECFHLKQIKNLI